MGYEWNMVYSHVKVGIAVVVDWKSWSLLPFETWMCSCHWHHHEVGSGQDIDSVNEMDTSPPQSLVTDPIMLNTSHVLIYQQHATRLECTNCLIAVSILGFPASTSCLSSPIVCCIIFIHYLCHSRILSTNHYDHHGVFKQDRGWLCTLLGMRKHERINVVCQTFLLNQVNLGETNGIS